MDLGLGDPCEVPAAFRRWWPGKAPDLVCDYHAEDSLKIAAVLDFELKLEPYEDAPAPCACSEGRVKEVRVKVNEGRLARIPLDDLTMDPTGGDENG